MITLKNIINEAVRDDLGPDTTVKVNKPGYEGHGKTGKIVDSTAKGYYTVNIAGKNFYFACEDLEQVGGRNRAGFKKVVDNVNEIGSGQTILVVYSSERGPLVASTDKSKAKAYQKWAEGQGGSFGSRESIAIKNLKVI